MIDAFLFSKSIPLCPMQQFINEWEDCKKNKKIKQLGSMFDWKNNHVRQSNHIVVQFQYHFKQKLFHCNKNFVHTINIMSNGKIIISNTAVEKNVNLLSTNCYENEDKKSIVETEKKNTNHLNIFHDTSCLILFRIIIFHSSFRISTRLKKYFLLIYENPLKLNTETVCSFQHTMETFNKKREPFYAIWNKKM